MNQSRTFLTAAVALLLAHPAVAQQHQHETEAATNSPGMGMMSGDMMSMMSGGMMMDMTVMGLQPAALLGSASVLELSDEQVQRLEALESEGHAAHREHAQSAMEARMRAASALQGDLPDLEAYSEAVTEAAHHMAMAHIGMARTAMEARGVLTPSQREKVMAATSMMKGMQGMKMMHGPTGDGGH